jgi:HEAT repeat protein
MDRLRSTVCFALFAGLSLSPTFAQEANPGAPVQQPASVQQAQQDSAKGNEQNFEPNEIRAWSILTDAAGPGRPAHDRIQAMAALGTLGNDERAARLIEEGFTAKDYDVRTAAALAVGLTRNPKLIAPLERVLDDDNPQVAYTAALTLWKMQDYSGQDLLIAVALGDRKAKPGLIKSERHKAAKDLHSPKTMAMLTINDSSGYFLGPFGVGVRAIELVDKNSSAPLRAAAVDQLAKQHTDQVHDVLVQDLTDPEPAVRAAAAKGLGRWTGEDTAKLVEPMFGDNKLAVRLTAAATYLRAIHNIPTPSDSECEF